MATISAPTDAKRWLIAGGVILVASFVIRALQFGNPLIEIDENFYLLVGDRMLHGALPFVDIWDRKPIGLFLIYAAIRLLGGVGILQMQIVATLFVAGTAFLIARIAAPMAGLRASVVAAILYILLLGLAGGMGGQSPVFYNLFVVGAALAACRAVTAADATPHMIRRLGIVAMALCGIALQIKYTALFEGIFFGILLVLASWRTSERPARVAADALLWIAIALLPTLLAWAYYGAIGEGRAFLYANFLSIGARSHDAEAIVLKRLLRMALILLIPLLCVGLAARLGAWRLFANGKAVFRFALLWLAAAIVGYLSFGTYFDHYALPLMAPIAVACAPLFCVERNRIGGIAAILLLGAGSIAYVAAVRSNLRRYGGADALNAEVAAIRPRLTNCLYVYRGDPILYHLTGSCLPSHYPFPPHLNLTREGSALGVDQVTEVRRILAGRPSVIADATPDNKGLENPATNAMVAEALRRNYRLVATVTAREAVFIYQRLPGQ